MDNTDNIVKIHTNEIKLRIMITNEILRIQSI